MVEQFEMLNDIDKAIIGLGAEVLLQIEIQPIPQLMRRDVVVRK